MQPAKTGTTVEPRIHAVEFYANEELLCDRVGHYVGAGLAIGEKVVVIATERHWRSLALRLADNAFDVGQACTSGKLRFVDVGETLAKFMAGATPDSQLFEEVIGGLLDDAGVGRIRAYAEIVDVLWAEGNRQGAIRVEELWNEFLETRAFALLCAYDTTYFNEEAYRHEFEELCRAHTHILPAESHASLDRTDSTMLQIAQLEQRARALESEIRQRERLEIALRDALLDRERLLVELENDRVRQCESEERLLLQQRRLALLYSITASFARALKPRDIAEVIVHQGTAAIGAPSGGIWLLAEDGRTLDLVRSTGFPAPALEHYSRLRCDSQMPIAHCHTARSEVWIESRAAYEVGYPEAAAESDPSSEVAMLCLPLVVEGRSFGACSMEFPHARTFTDEERSLLVTLAHHAAQALDRARLFEEAERIEGSWRFLSEVSAVLAGSLDYEETLAAVARLAVPRIADWASIDMLNPDKTFRRVAISHVNPQKIELGWEVLLGRPVGLHDSTGPGNVVRTGKAEVLEYSDASPERAAPDDGLRAIHSLGIVSALCIPLNLGGRPAGAMTLLSVESRRHFGEPDVALAEELARRASMAIDNARAYREAQDANRVKDEFLATMSHELRTPLNAILGWSAMLRARPDVDAQKAIATIERNARAQVRLIEEVLDISRIMTGKLRLDLKSIDLAGVLRASLDVVAPSALARGISLDACVAVEPCAFYGDGGRLQQVFWNLLSNAIKFTPKGGRVEASLTRSGSEVSLSVKDSGRGIRSDFLPVMFQRFRQADSSTTRTEGGLGIGLAIVGHVVELHGGTVKAYSAGEGRGATFTVTLPVRAVCGEQPRPSLALATVSKLLAGLRVLICEDDVDSRDLLHAVLSYEGATVMVAAAAGEAMEYLREFRPDVLVSDIGLPVVDGYALMRQIRELSADEGGRTPAIALTAYAGTEDARKAFSAGYQLHVAKPVDPNELAVRVANLAGRPGRIARQVR